MDTVRYFKTISKAHLRDLRQSGDVSVGLQHVQHEVAVEAGYRSWSALLSADEFHRQLAVAMHREPQLNVNGFGAGMYSRSAQERREQFAMWRSQLRGSAARVDEIREWLVRHVDARQTVNANAGSYHLKHLAEEDLGSYVSNGELIAAAIIAGYSYRRKGNGSPNATFGMSARSITDLRRRLRG